MNDVLNIYRKNGQKDEYKLLCIIEKDFKYVIYTNKENNNIKENLYVAKTQKANYLDEIIPMNDYDWELINKEYLNLLEN